MSFFNYKGNLVTASTKKEAIKKILATKTNGSVWTKQELDELGMTESELKKLSNESSKEIFEIA